MKLKKKHYHSLTVCLSIILIFAGIGSFFLLKKYINYRTGHPPTTYADSDKLIEEKLIFHWDFDELDRETTPDNSKNNIHGKVKYYFNDKFLAKLLYKPPTTTKGISGNSLQFTGKQWISAGNKAIYNTDRFTISLWIWQETDDIFMPTIMAKSSWRDNDDGYDGWWLCTTPKNRFIDLGIAWGHGKTHIKSGYQLPLKEWHHVAVAVDRQSNQIQFFIDGKAFGKTHKNVHKWVDNWDHDLFVAGYDGSQRWPWVGKLDDVRFYANTLPADKIAAIYSSRP